MFHINVFNIFHFILAKFCNFPETRTKKKFHFSYKFFFLSIRCFAHNQNVFNKWNKIGLKLNMIRLGGKETHYEHIIYTAKFQCFFVLFYVFFFFFFFNCMRTTVFKYDTHSSSVLRKLNSVHRFMLRPSLHLCAAQTTSLYWYRSKR